MIELTEKLENAVIKLAEAAGQAIMQIYDGPINVTVKNDDTPLTLADKAAHALIVDGLQHLTPQWPVVSEESDDKEKSRRLDAQCFWLVDPLDGTKEFIKRNGEFTVNIALIEKGKTRFGVVHVPATQVTYWGGKTHGAWRKNADGISAIHAMPPQANTPLAVVGSRSHLNMETDAYLATLGAYELVAVGSSLKFCLLAEGAAHLYPRLAPTCEWDTAAAQAVLEGAGGLVETLDGQPLRYGKPEILNPWFIAKSYQESK